MRGDATYHAWPTHHDHLDDHLMARHGPHTTVQVHGHHRGTSGEGGGGGTSRPHTSWPHTSWPHQGQGAGQGAGAGEGAA
ncbi:MAG: hypothetical protein ACK56I_17430, partial [bacterium]